MFCRNCGKEISSGAAFCPNCGIRIEQTASPANKPVQQSKICLNEGVKNKVKVAIMIAAAVLFCPIIINCIISSGILDLGQTEDNFLSSPSSESESYSYLLVGCWISVDNENETLSFSEDGEMEIRDKRNTAAYRNYEYKADEHTLYIVINNEEEAFAQYEVEDDILTLTIDDEEYAMYKEQETTLYITWVNPKKGLAMEFIQSGQVRVKSHNDIIETGTYTYRLLDDNTITIYTNSGEQTMSYRLTDNKLSISMNDSGLTFVLAPGEFADLYKYQQSVERNKTEKELTMDNYRQYLNITAEYRTGWYRVKINIDPQIEAEFQDVNITLEAEFEYAISGSKTVSGNVKLSKSGTGYLEIRDSGPDTTVDGARPATLSYSVRVTDISGKVIR